MSCDCCECNGEGPEPCYAPGDNGLVCREYDGHDGVHGNWFDPKTLTTPDTPEEQP